MTTISFKIYHNQGFTKSKKALEIINYKTKSLKIIKCLDERIDVLELK